MRGARPLRQRWAGGSRLVGLGLVLVAATAGAEGGEVLPGPGLLMGDEWRYPNRNIVFRFAADLVAIPAGVTRWSRDDFAQATAWSGAVLALMIGRPSWDTQVHRWANATFGPPGTRFTVLTKPGDALIWGSTWLVMGGFGLAGWLRGVAAWEEVFWLALEAFSVAEVHHAALKLLIGREGPENGEGLGIIHGPARSVSLWPAGTPSGHSMAFYAILGTVSAYVGNPWVTAALHVLGLAFCAVMVVDDYHFVSDLLWGAAMGWNTGTWVVRHRSTRAPPLELPVSVLPVVDPRGGAAVALAVRF